MQEVLHHLWGLQKWFWAQLYLITRATYPYVKHILPGQGLSYSFIWGAHEGELGDTAVPAPAPQSSTGRSGGHAAKVRLSREELHALRRLASRYRAARASDSGCVGALSPRTAGSEVPASVAADSPVVAVTCAEVGVRETSCSSQAPVTASSREGA